MDYKDLVDRLNEWNENLISELCADDVLTCDDLCGCTDDCIVVQAATAITDLLARAEKAERERDKIKSILRHYLSTNEENGVVYIPRNTVEKYAYGQKEE